MFRTNAVLFSSGRSVKTYRGNFAFAVSYEKGIETASLENLEVKLWLVVLSTILKVVESLKSWDHRAALVCDPGKFYTPDDGQCKVAGVIYGEQARLTLRSFLVSASMDTST